MRYQTILYTIKTQSRTHPVTNNGALLPPPTPKLTLVSFLINIVVLIVFSDYRLWRLLMIPESSMCIGK